MKPGKRQLLLVSTDEGLTLHDSGSAHGLRVNGKPVKRAVLADGDCVEVGDASFVVQLDSTPPRTHATDASPKSAGDSGAHAAPPARRRRAAPADASPTLALGLGLLPLHDAPTRADLLERAARLLLQALPAAREAAAMLLDFEGRRRDGSFALRRTARGVSAHDAWLRAAPVEEAIRQAWRQQSAVLADAAKLSRFPGDVRSIVAVPLELSGESTALLVACSGVEGAELGKADADAARVIAAHTARCAQALGA